MSQHTPGPLTCDGFRLLDSKGRQLARVSAGGATLHADEATANKRMFAKAPEMLLLLRSCVAFFDAQSVECRPDAQWIAPIRAILRDLEGA